MILYESQVREGTALGMAWAHGGPTFALIADRSDLDAAWITAAMERLPIQLRHDHFLLATSGSTGTPKLIVASRDRAEGMARAIGSAQRVEYVKTMVISLPLTYCFALVNQWVMALIHGMPKTTAAFSEPEALVEALDNSPASMICLVGAQADLLAEIGRRNAFPKVERVCFAGSPFPWSHTAVLNEIFPNARFFDNYGCAEAMPRLTVREVTDHVRGGTSPQAGFLGKPLKGIEFRASDDGELQFRSPYASLGYVTPNGYQPFEAKGWIGTGDSAIFESKEGWRLNGRLSEVFKRHGEKISLLRIRDTIDGVWNGLYALKRSNDRGGEEGYQVLFEGAVSRDAVREVLKAFRKKHPRAQWPLQILRVERLPRLENAKVKLTDLENLGPSEVLWDQHV